MKRGSDQLRENTHGSGQVAFETQHIVDEDKNTMPTLQIEYKSFLIVFTCSHCIKLGDIRDKCWSLHGQSPNRGDATSEEEIRIDQIGVMRKQ